MKKRKYAARTKLIEFLLDPSSYPHKPKTVKHLQTHISDVFIAPPFVYKIKKPVDFGFLDYTTLRKRRLFCEKEVELNSRLCDIYLGVEELSISDGKFKFGKGEKAIEYAVKMKRLKDKYFLKNLLKRGNLGIEKTIRIVETLVGFYKLEPMNKVIIEYGRPEKIKINIYGNITTARNFTGKTLSLVAHEAIKYYNDIFFEKRSSIFNERIKGGYIKDCHGDLHLGNINITPKCVCIHDCIEFNERFRYIDYASDIAFLAMDLDFNGRNDLSKFTVTEVSGRMGDRDIYKIIDFYKCYRASVRGKVESLKSEEKEIPEGEKKASGRRARDYYRLSLRYAVLGSKPAGIVVFGLIGTGKSTLAGSISKELSCDLFSSDIIRKGMFGITPTERRFESFDRGIYSKGVTDKVYGEIIKMGKKSLEDGKSVVIDASFSKRKYRKQIIDMAESLGLPLFFIQTKAGDNTIMERLIKREEIGKSISDARKEIFEEFRAEFDGPSELPGNRYLAVNSDKKSERTLIEALKGIIASRI